MVWQVEYDKPMPELRWRRARFSRASSGSRDMSTCVPATPFRETQRALRRSPSSCLMPSRAHQLRAVGAAAASRSGHPGCRRQEAPSTRRSRLRRHVVHWSAKSRSDCRFTGPPARRQVVAGRDRVAQPNYWRSQLASGGAFGSRKHSRLIETSWQSQLIGHRRLSQACGAFRGRCAYRTDTRRPGHRVGGRVPCRRSRSHSPRPAPARRRSFGSVLACGRAVTGRGHELR
jgi:hypothetical protein